MNADQIVAALQDGYISITASFWNYDTADWHQKEYTYKALKSQGIQPGDQVVVDTPRGKTDIVIVRSVEHFPELDFNNGITYKWVIQKVDRTKYDELLNNETVLAKQVRALLRANTRKQFLANFGEQLSGLANKDELLKELQQAALVEKPD